MENTVLKVKRVCYCCGSDRSWHNKWLLNWGTDFVLCTKCYARLFLHKRWNPQRYWWGKKCLMGFDRKSGQCSWCPNRVGNGCKQTQWHHERGYFIIFTWFGRIELCASCHRKETLRLNPNLIPKHGKYKNGKAGFLPREKKAIRLKAMM